MVTAEDRARRAINYQNAIQLAKAGVAIFPTMDKVPMVRAFNRLDDEIPPAEKVAIRKDVLEKLGAAPVHIGATRRLSTVKKLWHKFPDATPSIAPGPNGLIVIDPDRKNNGPAKFAEFCQANGGLPDSAVCIPTRDGGQHWYFKNAEGLGNSAGMLKTLGCDVKGVGGQVVAPGSIREDGKTYGSKDDLLRFLRAFTSKSLPELPGFVRKAIGDSAHAGNTVTEKEARALADQLCQTELPDASELLEPALGGIDFDKLSTNYDKLGRAVHEANRSDVRFNLAIAIKTERPETTVEEFAAVAMALEECGTFVDDSERSQGEYNWRDIAREWLRSSRMNRTNGDALSAVDDADDGDSEATPEPKKGKALQFEMESDVAASATLPDWLVGEVIEAETLCVIYGAPNAGKSLATLDLLYHVAAGKPWRGRDVKRGSVLYISVEGPNGTARRAKAWRAHHGIADGESLPLAFIRVDVDLFNDRKAAKAIVDAVALLESMTGLPCRAVAIDTVNAVTPGMDENSSADVGVFLRNLRTILANTGAAVIPVHHTGKDESRGLRGSNALLAKAETTLLVSDGVLTTKKMRDGRSEQAFPFQIKILNLWTDEKGKPVGAPVAVEMERGTALAAVDDDDAALMPTDTPADKLRGALRALEACVTAHAEITGDAVSEVGATRGQVFNVMNRDRKAAGLEGLKDRTIVTRLLDKLVESGQARRLGANRRTEYRLTD